MGLVAIVDAACKDRLVRQDRPPAEAVSEANLLTRNQASLGHPHLGLHDQLGRITLDQEDAALGLQGEPGQVDNQIKDLVKLRVQGDRGQRDQQDRVERPLDPEVLLDLQCMILRAGRVAWGFR